MTTNRYPSKTSRKHPNLALSVLTLAMLQVSLAQAQTATQPNSEQIAVDNNNIAHVVVTADTLTDPTMPTTAADSTLTAKDLGLQQSKTSDTATALTLLSGVNTQTAGGVSALPIFQGLADNRLRITVDGVDSVSSCPNHMNSPLSYVAPTAIKQAKIYSGVTPVSVSGNSIGSTIVIETTQPKFAKPKRAQAKSATISKIPSAIKQTVATYVINIPSDVLPTQSDNKTTANTQTLASVDTSDINNMVIVTEKQPVAIYQYNANQSVAYPVTGSLTTDKSTLSEQTTTSNRFNQSLANLATSGEIGSYYRSNGHQAGGNLEITTASENVSLTYKGSYARGNNYKVGGDFKDYLDSGNVGQTIDKDIVASTAFESKNQSLDLAYMTGNHLWQLGYNWQHIPYELYPNQRMDMLDNRLERYNLRYSGDLSWGTLEAQTYYETVDHFMDFGGDKRYWYGMPKSVGDSKNLNGKPCSPAGTKECANGMPMYTDSTTLGFNLKASRQLNEQTNLRAGLEYQDYQLDDWWPASGGGMYPHTFQNINNGQRQRMSVYGEWEKAISPTWTSLAGLRYENLTTQVDPVHGYNSLTAPTAIPTIDAMYQGRDAYRLNQSNLSQTDNNWNASLINRWQLSDTNNIELGLSHQTRSPSLYERYTWSTATMMSGMNNTVGDGNGYFGDPDLKPETSNKVAITWDLKDSNDKWHVKLTPYYSQIDDYIDALQWDSAVNKPKAVNAKNQYSVMRYTNQDARIYGLDASAEVKLGETRMGDFGLTAALNYTNGKNTETDSPLYNIMPLNGKLALTHQKNSWNNKVEVVGVSAKNDVSIPRNEIKTAGYGLLNLSTRYDWDNFNVTVGVDNALDKKYALPLGGAYMGQGRTMSMNQELGNGTSNWGTPIYGAGRSYFASLNYKF